jgi:hypothetical protein
VHRGETMEIREGGVRLVFGDETERQRCLDRGGSFVGLGPGVAEPLAAIVALARGGLGEIEIGAEKRVSKRPGDSTAYLMTRPAPPPSSPPLPPPAMRAGLVAVGYLPARTP